MNQNILTALDGWFDALPGGGDGLAKPGIGVVDAPTKAAANDSPPAQPGTTFYDLQDDLKTTSEPAVTSSVTPVSEVSGPEVASRVATESRVGQRQPVGVVASSVATESAPASWRPAKSPPDGWRPAADAYYSHHWTCRQCIAAGMNHDLKRCSIGAPLWVAYQRAVATMKRNAS